MGNQKESERYRGYGLVLVLVVARTRPTMLKMVRCQSLLALNY